MHGAPLPDWHSNREYLVQLLMSYRARTEEEHSSELPLNVADVMTYVGVWYFLFDFVNGNGNGKGRGYARAIKCLKWVPSASRDRWVAEIKEERYVGNKNRAEIHIQIRRESVIEYKWKSIGSSHSQSHLTLGIIYYLPWKYTGTEQLLISTWRWLSVVYSGGNKQVPSLSINVHQKTSR